MTERTQPAPSRRDIWRMFDRISPGYDRMNRLITGGLDRRWRRALASRLPDRPGLRVLDLATGTGDQLVACLETGRVSSAVGIDLAERMLEIGRAKLARHPAAASARLGVGDALAIPEPDASFDAVTISFGIRNVTDVPHALREMARILKPGGRALILESSVPASPLPRLGHRLYTRHIMPRLAGALSGAKDAYQYLNVTTEQFPVPAEFRRLMEQAGFAGVRAFPYAMGSVTIYQGDIDGGAR